MSDPSLDTASSLARALGEKYEVKKLVGFGIARRLDASAGAGLTCAEAANRP